MIDLYNILVFCHFGYLNPGRNTDGYAEGIKDAGDCAKRTEGAGGS